MSRADPHTHRRLNAHEMSLLIPYIARVDLESAVLHTDGVPWYLPNQFCAIVRGNRVYFRPGAYEQNSAAGLALLGHELTHVTQYRNGMTAAGYLCSLVFGYMNSRYEKEAYAVQAQILEDLTPP